MVRKVSRPSPDVYKRQILTLLVNRSVPANPDTHYTGTNGVSVYYDSSIWKVCQMTEDSTLGTVLELATADSADGEDYEAVLLLSLIHI